MNRPNAPATAEAVLTIDPVQPITIIKRVFNAPRRLVFEAYTQPEHVRRWYGPRYLSMTVCEIDLRPGGAWRYVLQAPDGGTHGFSGVYREIVPHERLVFTEGYEPMPEADYVVTAIFEEQDGKTTLTSTLVYREVAHRDGHIAAGMESGMRESCERIDELIDALDYELVTTRVFNAPRERVWEAWTDRERIGKWWGPNGFTTTTHEMDVRPGGVWRFIMHGPDGVDWPNRIVYEQVVKPERLVYLHDADDDISDDPQRFANTVTFDVEGGKTRVTMRARFSSREARAAVVGYAVEGGKQTLGRLANYLSLD